MEPGEQKNLRSPAPWQTRSAPLLQTASPSLRRATGLLSAAAVELIGDGRASTPGQGTRLGSRLSTPAARNGSASLDSLRPGTGASGSRHGGWAKGGQNAPSNSLWLPGMDSKQTSTSPNKQSAKKRAKIDDKISYEFEAESTKPSSSSRPSTRQNGPSPVALLENYKRERYNRRIEHRKTVSLSMNQKLLDSLEGAEVGDIQKPEDFLRDVSALERQVQDCTRTIRLEHLGKDPKELEADRMRAEKNAQKAWEEAEQRRLRKKESMARDPHKKIELRLENKRRFEMDTLDKAGIPMQTLDFAGGKGPEQVTLVDVRLLQSKCNGLGESGGVRTLLELAVCREKRERMLAGSARAKPSTALSCQTTLDSVYSDRSLDRTLSVMSGTWDERLPGVLKQKRDLFKEDMNRKLDQMRQPLPNWFSHDLYDGDPLEAGGSSGSRPGSVNRPGSRNRPGSVNRPDSRGVFRSAVRQIDGLDEISFEEELAGLDIRTPDSGARGNLSSGAGSRTSQASPEVIAKAKKGWLQAKGFINILRVWFRHKRELDSIAIVRAFMRQMGEWARLKNDMGRLVRNVKILQRRCREFLALREKRCSAMMKDWKTVEDAYLQAYFKIYCVKIMEEHQQQVEQDMLAGLSGYAQANPNSSMAYKRAKAKCAPNVDRSNSDIQGLMASVLDWRTFRIPPTERKKAVIRFYMIQLLRQQNSRKKFRDGMVAWLKDQKEMAAFLRSFGAEKVACEAAPLDDLRERVDNVEHQTVDFWHFPEALILDTIGLCAQALKRVAPFKDHPANKYQVLPDKCFDEFCRVPKQLSFEIRQAITAEIDPGSRPSANARRKCLVLKPDSMHSKQRKDHEELINNFLKEEEMGAEAGTRPRDLDDLWSSFSPRHYEEISATSPRTDEEDAEAQGQDEQSTLWPAVPSLKNGREGKL